MALTGLERDIFGGIAGAVDKVLHPSRERLTWAGGILDGSHPISDVDREGFREGLITKQTPRFFRPTPDLLSLSERYGVTWYCADQVGFQRMVRKVKQMSNEYVDRAILAAARRLVAREEVK